MASTGNAGQQSPGQELRFVGNSQGRPHAHGASQAPDESQLTERGMNSLQWQDLMDDYQADELLSQNLPSIEASTDMLGAVARPVPLPSLFKQQKRALLLHAHRVHGRIVYTLGHHPQDIQCHPSTRDRARILNTINDIAVPYEIRLDDGDIASVGNTLLEIVNHHPIDVMDFGRKDKQVMLIIAIRQALGGRSSMIILNNGKWTAFDKMLRYSWISTVIDLQSANPVDVLLRVELPTTASFFLLPPVELIYEAPEQELPASSDFSPELFDHLRKTALYMQTQISLRVATPEALQPWVNTVMAWLQQGAFDSKVQEWETPVNTFFNEKITDDKLAILLCPSKQLRDLAHVEVLPAISVLNNRETRARTYERFWTEFLSSADVQSGVFAAAHDATIGWRREEYD